ncbi:aminopeptidase P family protein [Vibrio sp. S4M6]|uniref:aminopeptidase P family protein n=1 Tax=Vibrio sinus TaxID=2946865 RepID=UPI002029D50D|nr:aminopeptidase P family protein [Vibrio sinus]MCL9782859.1 aminopeptidase P family protein [Vibrio sinus]
MLETVISKVNALRSWLEQNNYDAIIIPHEDEYLGEYIPKHNERLHWLTGFTGSAGAAVISRDSAAMFVDGRYTVQVKSQVPSDLFEYCHLIDFPPVEWIKAKLSANSRIAFDPKMHSNSWYESTSNELAAKFQLVEVTENPIDALWSDRPAAIESSAYLMSTQAAGTSSVEKRLEVAKTISDNDAKCAVISSLDSICWLLNVRGTDVSRLPVLLSQAIIFDNGQVEFFIDQSRLPENFSDHVGEGVNVFAPTEFESRLQALENQKVMIDPSTSNAWLKLTLDKVSASIVPALDPCALPKAIKNPAELSGMKSSHIKDGVAMVKFLSWLDKQVEQSVSHTEATLADRLQQFREEEPSLVDLSFDTISATGGNAAMCHYNHKNQEHPAALQYDSLYLVDSGGQYHDGTTDITRTIAIGKPSAEMTKQFTLVLKGHISVAQARFPKGTCGYQIDTLARHHLWAEGYDYDHGTGHGVGHFLSVHEGPQSISKKQINVPLEAGMILSNEPGYYKADAYGIRIENLETVVEQESSGDFPVLTFESLTRCPIDTRCIDVTLLTQVELAWLNDYHQKVWSDLNTLVDGETKDWLRNATQPVTHS